MGSGLVTPGHLLVLLVIVLLVFGPKRLPELGRSLGGGMRGFKDAITGDHDSEEPARAEISAAAPPPPGAAAPTAASHGAPPAPEARVPAAPPPAPDRPA